MSYNLFLDDIRIPNVVVTYKPSLVDPYLKEDWIIARNYEEFVHIIITDGLPNIISFDHDLAAIHYNPNTYIQSFEYEEKTGLDCAKWLVEYCIKFNKQLPKCYIHSQNPIGALNIEIYLNNFKKYYER